VEGYVESIASGLMAGNAAAMAALSLSPEERVSYVPGPETIMGSLVRYVSNPDVRHFQPMNANFGLLPPLAEPIRQKDLRYQAFAERSLQTIQPLADQIAELQKKTGR